MVDTITANGAATDTVITQPDAPAGTAEQPAEHWADNAENCRRFWAKAKSILVKYEIPDDPHEFVHRVAGVDSLKKYQGSGAELIEKVELEAHWLQPELKPYVPLTEAEIRRKYNAPQKGRPYLVVEGRLLLFWLKHPTGCIDTECVRADEQVAVFKTVIRDGEGNLLATGYGYAAAASTKHLGDKHIQMAETNSVSRALLHSGFGLDMAGTEMDEGQAQRKGKHDQKRAAAPPAQQADRQPSRRLN